MRFNAIRILGAVFAFGLILISISYASYKKDPFMANRDFVKKPLSIGPKKLVHYAKEEQLIREKLAGKLSTKERSILSGLHWVLGLMDEDKNFKNILSDFLLMTNSLTNSRGRLHQQEVAIAIGRTSLLRAKKHLPEIFDKEEDSAWRFLQLLPILSKYPDLQTVYFEFYKKQWPNFSKTEVLEVKEFIKDMHTQSYQNLFDSLVITSFPHYYRMKFQNLPVEVPEDKFPDYIKQFEQFTYQEHPIEDPKFRILGYLATHVPLVLTNYCEYAPKNNVNMRKVKKYVDESFGKAHDLGDFDLYVEYILCKKMFGAHASEVKTLEKFIYNLQRPDGSWGNKNDFATSSYTAIHPTGAALMSLNCDF